MRQSHRATGTSSGGRVGRFTWRNRDWLGDFGTTLAALVFLLLFLLAPPPTLVASAPGVALTIASFAAVAVSGRYPVQSGIVLMGILTCFLLLPGVDATFPTLTGWIVVGVGVARGQFIVEALITLWLALLTCWPGAEGWSLLQADVLSVTLFGVATWTVGLALHREAERRRRAESSRDTFIREQRAAIANDLHDTIAQANARIALRAQDIQERTAGTPLADDLQLLIDLSRQNADDLRTMMATLLVDTPSVPDPDAAGGEEDVRTYLEGRRHLLAEHGLDLRVAYEVAGLLGDSTRRALIAVCREATANMIKHAQPGACSIQISREEEFGALDVIATNTVLGRRRVPDSGFGLRHVAAMIEALGGTIESHETSPGAGTWLLSACIPDRGRRDCEATHRGHRR